MDGVHSVTQAEAGAVGGYVGRTADGRSRACNTGQMGESAQQHGTVETHSLHSHTVVVPFGAGRALKGNAKQGVCEGASRQVASQEVVADSCGR